MLLFHHQTVFPSPAALPGSFRDIMQCREVLHYFPPQPPFLLGLPGIATAQSMEAFKRILPPAATAHPARPADNGFVPER